MRDETEPPEDPEGETVLGPGPAAHDTDRQGDRIGPYLLVRRLGEGGMGEVWLGQQEEPIRRQVAVKLIKPSMTSREIAARFEAERQALALMDHPNDREGATTRAPRRPVVLYFAMELRPRSSRSREYCEHGISLGTRQRLTPVHAPSVDAVQHAHQKGVIHRDLKPTNILVSDVDGSPVPKVIDFGLAKALSAPLTDRSLATEVGQFLGTPEYMSPEQADSSWEAVDTRTDVYALGVVLYELLTGVLPHDSKALRAAGLAGIRRFLREAEVPRPSDRPSTQDLAGRHDTTIRGLASELRGDLDWIALRAIEKLPDRRYPSPRDLAEDLQRHLKNEPVVAGPPSASYRLGKFVRRHRVAVAVAATVVLLLITGSVGTSIGLVRARRAEAEARQEQAAAERVSGFLADLVGEVDPEQVGSALREDLIETLGAENEEMGARMTDRLPAPAFTELARKLVAREFLERAADTLEEELADDPLVQARLHHTINEGYWTLGMYESGLKHARDAVSLREKDLGPEHRLTLQSRLEVAQALREMGRRDEAMDEARGLLEVSRRVLGPDDADILAAQNEVGMLCVLAEEYDEAVEILESTIAGYRRALGDEHQDTLNAINNLAITYWRLGRLDDAERMLTEQVRIERSMYGGDHPEVAGSMNNLGALLSNNGKREEAEKVQWEVVLMRRRMIGRKHPDTLMSQHNHAMTLEALGRMEEALESMTELETLRSEELGPDNGLTIGSRGQKAIYTARLGRPEEAIPIMQSALESNRRLRGDDHVFVFRQLSTLGWILTLADRPAEAVTVLRDAMQGLEQAGKDFDHGDVRARLGGALLRLGRLEEAEEYLDAAHEILSEDSESRFGKLRFARVLFELGCLSARKGDRAAALDYLRQAREVGLPPPAHVRFEDPLLDPLRDHPEFRELLTAE